MEHIAGKDNVLADTLSRLSTSQTTVHDIANSFLSQEEGWQIYQPTSNLLSLLCLAASRPFVFLESKRIMPLLRTVEWHRFGSFVKPRMSPSTISPIGVHETSLPS